MRRERIRQSHPNNRVYTSYAPWGGPKMRGNALQIVEKYEQFADEEYRSGDRAAAQNMAQHAEHYRRVAAGEPV